MYVHFGAEKYKTETISQTINSGKEPSLSNFSEEEILR